MNSTLRIYIINIYSKTKEKSTSFYSHLKLLNSFVEINSIFREPIENQYKKFFLSAKK